MAAIATSAAAVISIAARHRGRGGWRRSISEIAQRRRNGMAANDGSIAKAAMARRRMAAAAADDGGISLENMALSLSGIGIMAAATK